MAAHGSGKAPETPEDELKSLSKAGQELLALSEKVLEKFHPEPGALGDLPQITVDRKDAASVCKLAKEDSRLALQRLLCLACVDYKETFQLVYILNSMDPEKTLVVKADVPYEDPSIPSVASIWKAGEWYEREAHDLFGVTFDGNADMSPLLLYEEFEGYPGRKEYDFYDYHEF